MIDAEMAPRGGSLGGHRQYPALTRLRWLPSGLAISISSAGIRRRRVKLKLTHKSESKMSEKEKEKKWQWQWQWQMGSKCSATGNTSWARWRPILRNRHCGG